MILPNYTPSSATEIFKHYVSKEREWRRPHLGASAIGIECERALWYSFRWATAPEYGRGALFDHPGQTLRLFERGHREEEWLAADLVAAGVKLDVVDPETGRQFQWHTFGDHFGGSADGIGTLFPEGSGRALWECKTHNAKSWRALVKHGIRKQKEQHYAQVQVYMKLSGLKRCYYFAVNKDTDQIHVIVIKYDAAEAKSLFAKAKRVIFADRIPPRIKDDPKFFKCLMCDHREQCHEPDVGCVETHCRTCTSSKPLTSGGWDCTFTGGEIALETQLSGCEHYSIIPELAPNATEERFK